MNAYTRKRKPAGDAILELALQNYIEMRDLTGDPAFLQQKKLEARLQKKHPHQWQPLYSQDVQSHPLPRSFASGKNSAPWRRSCDPRNSGIISETTLGWTRCCQHFIPILQTGDNTLHETCSSSPRQVLVKLGTSLWPRNLGQSF